MTATSKTVLYTSTRLLNKKTFSILVGICLIGLLYFITMLKKNPLRVESNIIKNNTSVTNYYTSETMDFISFLKDQGQHMFNGSNDVGNPEKGKNGKKGNHIQREYMNPVKAILEQNEWKGAFLKELYLNKTINTTIAQTPMCVEFPETLNQTNYPKNVTNFPRINCAKLFDMDPYHLMQVEKLMIKKNAPSPFVQPKVLIQSLKNCTKFIQNNGYIMENVSQSEQDFPIAYSIVVYKDISQVEHLIRAIYRPQNLYCIHVDKKSERSFKEAAQQLAACFDNVFISSRSTSVFWGRYSVLEADLICMENLWKKSQNRKRKWKYFINLTGQEFPLKTNWEIVQILKANERAVWVGASLSNTWAKRWKYSYSFRTKSNLKYPYSFRTKSNPKYPYSFNTKSDTLKPYETPVHAKGTPPHPYKFAKGSVHVALPYYFVNYILNDKIAIHLKYWLQDTEIPDETFFPTLVSSKHLGVPGAHTGPFNYDDLCFSPLVRFKKWNYERPCRGKEQRMICILGLWDLQELKIRPEFFANKFESDYHPVAYMCLEELHWNKTREEMLSFRHKMEPRFDTSPYQYLPWIRQSNP